jgi:hypothetical protein
MLTNASRRIVTLMGFAVIFSVIGAEIKAANPAKNSPQPSGSSSASSFLSAPAKIILGGTIAAALLSFLAEAGQAGEEYAVGLAAVAAGTAMLVNGAPVWQALNTVFNSKPTGSTGTTGTTSPTPTASSPTAQTMGVAA